MQFIYYYIEQPSNLTEKYSFRAPLRQSGRLVLSVPGDACDLGSISFGQEAKKEEGYTFSTHNPDNVVQQLSLFSALAKLHDLYEESTGS